ncbi:MAG: hypothetical protein DHS20C20_24520 [Ardenticatenaceae bacterium]|nr:MAG: hypothetical protein DHS20C20_24520 [Ardenticatenaceae bacterium]
MSDEKEPLIKLDPGGKAPILSYNVPEPTTYAGRNFIELDILDENEDSADVYLPKAFELPKEERDTVADLNINEIQSTVATAMRTGFANKKLFPNIQLTSGTLRFDQIGETAVTPVSATPVTSILSKLNTDEVAYNMQAGRRLNVYTSFSGATKYNYLPEPKEAVPHLYLIETYRLSTFLGNYGAGRIIKTFTLLPGEKTKISVKTFTKTESQRKSSSSILDSFTEESADDFESSLQEEQSDKQAYAKSFEYHAEAEAKAGWGWGSAKVSGGVKGSTNASREEFSKSVSNATQKHSAKASAKRDIQIDTSYEVSESSGQETSIEREIENINLSRTLNFVFRQMNQEFFTFLTLVDVRVAFFNGFAESRREVSLAQLDTLLNDYVVENRRDAVREAIFGQLETVLDYKDDVNSVIEEKTLSADDGYIRFKKDLVSVYQDEVTAAEFAMPGVITSVMKNVMRTEGVIVEALLGQGEALDDYATRLQELEVSRREAEVAKETAVAAQSALINQLVTDKDQAGARILAELTCPCGAESGNLDINIAAQPNNPRSDR